MPEVSAQSPRAAVCHGRALWRKTSSVSSATSPSRPVGRAYWSAPASGCAATRPRRRCWRQVSSWRVVLVGGSFWLAVRASPPAGCRGSRLQGIDVNARERPLGRSAGCARTRRTLGSNGFGPDDLRRRLGQARRDLDFVIELDSIRLKRVTRGELLFYKTRANREYAEAFQRAGLGTIARSAFPRGDLDRPHRRCARRFWLPCTTGLVCAADKAQRAWLLEVGTV